MKLRFSIRDLLWLTLVVGMGVAWYIDRSRVANQRDENYRNSVRLAIESLTAKKGLDYHLELSKEEIGRWKQALLNADERVRQLEAEKKSAPAGK